jgi:hypothetical protein
MPDIVLNGVSTRGYGEVIPAVAETVGISKSSASRETIAASEAKLEQLLNRLLEELDLLVIYLCPHRSLLATYDLFQSSPPSPGY